MLAAVIVQAQSPAITDIGATAPTPGPNDISQLTFGDVAPANLNYYWDNGANNGAYMGQSFKTGNNPQGYTLTTLAIQTSGNGGSAGAQLGSQSFTLNLYQLSGTGLTSASLVNTATATGALAAEDDWLQWTGLGFSLAPNSSYAYTFGRSPGSPGDWERLSTVTGQPYAGGLACSIVTAGGAGTVTYASDGSDATFDIGLILPAAPIANPPVESPAYGSGGIVAGASVSFLASAAGSQPIGYFWQTDGGSGGALTNIPGAAGTNLLVNTTGFAVGAYQFDFVATNSLGASTSSIVNITIAPVAMMDIGSNAPAPGPNDISQLLNTQQNDDGFNYYTDDGAGHGNWCGQTFTTGTNANGYLLQTLAWKSAGNGNSFGVWQPYDLYFYSISADGTTATLIANYQGYGGGLQEDWFQWQGLSVALAPNKAYAYAFGRDASATGWEHIGTQGGNPYLGGQLITIANANTNGGPVTYGTTGNSDATFSLGLVISQKPFANVPTYTPFVNPIYAATPVTLNEQAVGTPPLTYQWLTDNGTGGALVPVGNATGSNLVVNTAGFSGAYKYAAIVNNTFGASTSAPVTLNFIAASAPILVKDIAPATTNEGYVGQTLRFSTAFTGTLPITYQWYLNKGSGPVAISIASNPTAGTNTLVLTNLQLNQAGIYTVTANNSQGSLPSSSSDLAVFPDPAAPAAGSYAAFVVADSPSAYWQLNETNDPSVGVLPAYDASGHNLDGVYGATAQNAFNGVAGPQAPAFPGFATNNGALLTEIGTTDPWVTLPPLNLNTDTVTIAMWINPAGAVSAASGLLFGRSGTDAAGLGFGSAVNAAGVAELGYNWNTNSAAAYNFQSGLYPPVGQWSFVALVVQSNQATIYLYYLDSVTGQPDLYSAVNPIAHGPESFSDGTNTIGTDAYDLETRVFNGDIDEAAVFNSALTSSQLFAMFSKGTGTGPVAASITTQPQSAATYVGNTVTLAASGINGSGPITYQWQFGGVNLSDGGQISGSQTPTLTIADAASANSGTYQLLVTNPVAVTASSNVTVTVVTPVPDSYEAAVVASKPYAFWKLNETNNPALGGVPAFDLVGGPIGTYQTGAENGFNGIAGPEAPAYPGFPTVNTALGTTENLADSYVTASAGTLLATNLTYALWINPSGPVENWAGLIMDRGGVGEGLGFGGEANSSGMSSIGYTWNQNSTWSYDSGLFPPANTWSFVAVVIEPSQATIYLINSGGVQTAVNPIAHDSEAIGTAWRIGDDAAEGTAGARTFPGSIADVSVVLSALSSSQITALYDAGLGIVQGPVTIDVSRAGADSLTLTWSRGTLLESTNVLGPWTSTTATSPYTVGTTNDSTFFKVLVQ
ncbi:MAG: LamG-like jellyroll fold domain-containing protein [Verrucomicrobiota bacterium]